jgi:hypothetical protein
LTISEVRDRSIASRARQETAMNGRTLEDRVDMLEQRVQSLEVLPERVAALELQISQFRGEVRAEFSTMRLAMREGQEQLRLEMRALNEETKTHMLVLHEEVISRLALLSEGMKGRRPRKT